MYTSLFKITTYEFISLCVLCLSLHVVGRDDLCGLYFVFSVAMLYICRANFTNPPFFCKTNPILCVFSTKTAIRGKNKPNSKPNKPNFERKMHYTRSLPRPVGAKQTQFRRQKSFSAVPLRSITVQQELGGKIAGLSV